MLRTPEGQHATGTVTEAAAAARCSAGSAPWRRANHASSVGVHFPVIYDAGSLHACAPAGMVQNTEFMQKVKETFADPDAPLVVVRACRTAAHFACT